MSEDVSGNVTGNEATEPREELLEKLRRATEKSNEIKGIKKSMSKGYNDEIKELDDEIKGILKQLG